MNDSRLQTIGLLQVGVWVIAGVLFLLWAHRAYRNLPALGARHLQYSPAWAIGGFFVPFLSLVRPYQVVREIWKASDPAVMEDTAWHHTAPAPLVGWWWALFLASNLIHYVVGRLALVGTHVETFLTISWWMVTAHGLSALTAILAIQVVRTIDKRQHEKYQRLMTQSALQCPPTLP